MGVSPDIWGPSTWAFLHLMPFAEEEPLQTSRLTYYQQLYQLLTNLLPCQKCREHLQQNLAKMEPITGPSITTKKDLFLWTSKLHNHVNQLHGKKEYPLDETYAYWKKIAEGKMDLKGVPCSFVYWKYATIFLLLIVIFFSLRSLRGRGPRRY